MRALRWELSLDARENDPNVALAKIIAWRLVEWMDFPYSDKFQVEVDYKSIPQDLIPGGEKTRLIYVAVQKDGNFFASYNPEDLKNYLKKQLPRYGDKSVVSLRVFLDPTPGYVFRNFAPKLEDPKLGKVGWYELAIDVSQYFRFSDNRASEWWLMKEKIIDIKHNSPYDLNIKFSGEIGVTNGVRLEFLGKGTYADDFENLGVALQYQVAGRKWNWITPKQSGSTHVADITYDPVSNEDFVQFRIVPIRNAFWVYTGGLPQDYSVYNIDRRVDLLTAQSPAGGSPFKHPRIYKLEGVGQKLEREVKIPGGDLKVKFTGRTHDAGSSGFSLVSATFDGVDWKQALKQANGGRDLVTDGDKDGVSLVISTGAYPKNADLNLVSENPIYFRIEDFVAYYRGELVADSLGRLTYKSTGKVVTGWEETAQDKLTYLPASEGIKVSSKHIGTPLLADMVARFASNSSNFLIDSTSWIDRDNEWIDGVKIYYPIDNLQPRLKLVGDTTTLSRVGKKTLANYQMASEKTFPSLSGTTLREQARMAAMYRLLQTTLICHTEVLPYFLIEKAKD